MPNSMQFDHYLNDEGPAALVLREYLMPVEGPDAVLFPATFAAGNGFPGGYNVNSFGDARDGNNVCLIDSVGSQANRIEPLFLREKYRHLVPQIVVRAGEKEVNLLDAGHRAGDALLRCSSLQDELQKAFRSELSGDCEPLAQIAPTSLVFGVWDSRETQSKRPRLVTSTIRAFNVRELTRGAVYIPPLDYTELECSARRIRPKPKAITKARSRDADSCTIRRPAHTAASLRMAGFAATLRSVSPRCDTCTPAKSRRRRSRSAAILGLPLVAFTAPMDSYLRHGRSVGVKSQTGQSNQRELCRGLSQGRRQPCDITHEAALQYATGAAEGFGVGGSRTVPFEKERETDVKADEGGKGKAKRGPKNGRDLFREAGGQRVTFSSHQYSVPAAVHAQPGREWRAGVPPSPCGCCRRW